MGFGLSIFDGRWPEAHRSRRARELGGVVDGTEVAEFAVGRTVLYWSRAQQVREGDCQIGTSMRQVAQACLSTMYSPVEPTEGKRWTAVGTLYAGDDAYYYGFTKNDSHGAASYPGCPE